MEAFDRTETADGTAGTDRTDTGGLRRPLDHVEHVEVVLPATELEATLAFFQDLGFELAMIMPADAPTTAVVVGHGLRLRLEPGGPGGPGALRLATTTSGTTAQSAVAIGGTDSDPGPSRLVAPNGTIVELVAAERPLDPSPLVPSFVISSGDHADGGDGWHTGRAGMHYRDLIPDRQGGRFIASHISIPDGGPVPDYVHHHQIRFQLIFCYRGWAELVYEDQGPPFRFEAGDCVLQPPHIRHQVLATSDRFEVVEVGSPAVHETYRDPDLALPTATPRPDRRYGGQRFVHHRAAGASWGPWRFDGFGCRRFGLGAASGDVGGARIVRPRTDGSRATVPLHRHDAELVFWFVTEGRATLARPGGSGPGDRGEHLLAAASSAVLPRGEVHGLHSVSDDFELLEVTLPAWPRPDIVSDPAGR